MIGMINDFLSAYPCCCNGFNTVPVDTTSTTKTSTITSSCGYPCPYQFINTNQQQSFCSDTTFSSNYACCCIGIATLISTSSSTTSTTTKFAPLSSTTCNKINSLKLI